MITRECSSLTMNAVTIPTLADRSLAASIRCIFNQVMVEKRMHACLYMHSCKITFKHKVKSHKTILISELSWQGERWQLTYIFQLSTELTSIAKEQCLSDRLSAVFTTLRTGKQTMPVITQLQVTLRACYLLQNQYQQLACLNGSAVSTVHAGLQ